MKAECRNSNIALIMVVEAVVVLLKVAAEFGTVCVQTLGGGSVKVLICTEQTAVLLYPL